MDSAHPFIKFCKLLRQPTDDPIISTMSSTEVGGVVEVLRLLRPGFASKNTRAGEPAEGLQLSYIDGCVVEQAGKRRSQARRLVSSSSSSSEKKTSSSSSFSSGAGSSNKNSSEEEDAMMLKMKLNNEAQKCSAVDAAQVLLFDKQILNDGQLLAHASDFMKLFERLRRRERLMSSNSWMNGETLPLRLALSPSFSVTGRSTNWQQLSFMLLASCGVWSRSLSAENYNKVENIIGAHTGVFNPHVLFSSSGLNCLPPASVWRLASMFSAALGRAVAGNRQAAFSMFVKIVISSIERPPQRSPDNFVGRKNPTSSSSSSSNNPSVALSPLSVAAFLSDCRKLCSRDSSPFETERELTPLATIIANACGVSSIDTELEPEQLFDGVVSTVGDEPPVVHVAGSLSTPIQEVSFDVGGVTGGAGASVFTTVSQEPEYIATLSWARRIARSVWQNESAEHANSYGARRPLSEWVAFAIASRITDLKAPRDRDFKVSSDTLSSSSSSFSGGSGSKNMNTSNSSNNNSVPLVVPLNVQHITIDTSSGSDADEDDKNPSSDKNASSSGGGGRLGRPGTLAGRRLLQRALEVMFPRPQQQQKSSTTNAAAASGSGSSPGSEGRKRGPRQYPTSMSGSGGAQQQTSSSATAATAATTGSGSGSSNLTANTSVGTGTSAVFSSEFANHLAGTVKNLRLVGTAESASALASIVGDARATSRLSVFNNDLNDYSSSSSSSASAASGANYLPKSERPLSYAWNRHRGYRVPSEHGPAETKNTLNINSDNKNDPHHQSEQQQSSNPNNNLRSILPPTTTLFARYLGKCLEESLRHASAVSSAVVSHSVARTCTEAPGSTNMPQLKPAETTCSPGMWSTYAAVSVANELVSSARKLVEKMLDEEEYVRVSMNRAIGMNTLDGQLDHAKRGLSRDALDLETGGTLPKSLFVTGSSSSNKNRTSDSNKQQRRPANDDSTAPPSPSNTTTNEQSQESQQQQVKFQKPKPLVLFTKQELLSLTDSELQEVLSSLHHTEQKLRDKIEDTKTSDQEASAALSRAELLVHERESDLRMSEADLASQNERFQIELQRHLDEFVKSERQNIHAIERHSRHAWRLDDPNQRSLNKRVSGETKFGSGAKESDQLIDVDSFLGRVDKFLLIQDMDDDELLNSSVEKTDSNNNDNTANNDESGDNNNNAENNISDNKKEDHHHHHHSPSSTVSDEDHHNKSDFHKITKARSPQFNRNSPHSNKNKKQSSSTNIPKKKRLEKACCMENDKILEEIRASTAQIEHALLGVPKTSWSAGVAAQLNVAANSVDCPLEAHHDHFHHDHENNAQQHHQQQQQQKEEELEWTHILTLDALEGGTTTSSSNNSSSAMALIELVGSNERSTNQTHSLLPPPINSKKLSTLGGSNTAMYLVGSSVAIPSLPMMAESDNASDDDNTSYHHGRAGLVVPAADTMCAESVALAIADPDGKRHNHFVGVAVTNRNLSRRD